MMQQNKVYVGNFPYSVDEAQLRDIFSVYGEISELALITDRETGRSKGFAFITFATQQAAEKSLEQDGKEVAGRKLRVNMAQERDSKGGGGGGRGRSGGGGGGGRSGGGGGFGGGGGRSGGGGGYGGGGGGRSGGGGGGRW
jgi:RNA recognition motif-containing protein